MFGTSTAELAGWSDVIQIDSITEATEKLEGIVVAAGFEERAFRILHEGQFCPNAVCLLIRYRNSVVGNRSVFERFREAARERFDDERIHIVNLDQDRPERLEADIADVLTRISHGARKFGIDLSGMTGYAACMSLWALRTHRAVDPLAVFYTAARQYNPTREEYEKLIETKGDEIELLPRSLALEMGSTLILDSFAGYRSQNARTCLAIMAGYEVHRSTGVMDAVNPSLLLLLYGRPGDESLQWRLDLSQRLHRKFERGRRAAVETVSTLYFQETLDALERYYEFLIDDYDLVISPIGSKMQTLATYLFWERFPEVQLNFPLPIGYDPTHGPTGVGETYLVTLEPKRPLFRGTWRDPLPT